MGSLGYPHRLLFLLLCPGLKEKCVDNLVFETLIPKPMMQHYISLLLKHRRLVLSGPSGTGKTYLTYRLAEYLVDRSSREAMEGIAVTYNMHRQSCKVKDQLGFQPSIRPSSIFSYPSIMAGSHALSPNALSTVHVCSDISTSCPNIYFLFLFLGPSALPIQPSQSD